MEINFTVVLFPLVLLQTGNYSAKLITKLIIYFKYAKLQYLTDLCEHISKGSSTQFWSYFRYLYTKGVKSNHNNNTFTANDINSYFLSVPYNTVVQFVPLTSLSPLSNLRTGSL